VRFSYAFNEFTLNAADFLGKSRILPAVFAMKAPAIRISRRMTEGKLLLTPSERQFEASWQGQTAGHLAHFGIAGGVCFIAGVIKSRGD
jgi:hypothetical protein